MLAVRRKPSVLEFEMEAEKEMFEHELGVLEPRDRFGECEVHVVGIFEVLDGKF